MAHTEQSNVKMTQEQTLESQKRLYKGVMDFTMKVGIPVGGAISMFVGLILMQTGIPIGLFVSFLTWIALLVFAKAFLVH